MRAKLVLVATMALALIAAGGMWGLRSGGSRPASDTAAEPATRLDQLTIAIGQAQSRLRAVPGDYHTWAALGSAYLERARISADPTWYAKAEGALRKSLALRSTDNPDALTGLGALANARHEFARARELARQALRINNYSAEAYGVLVDALTQLGQSREATEAAQHMLDLRPGLAALTRAAYDRELHGDLGAARALMTRALNAAIDPADIAFCRYQLGELAFNTGDLTTAGAHYDAGLRFDPDYLPLLAGRAKVAAARGQLVAALTDYATITSRTPSPSYLLEYAQLLRRAGRATEAASQLELAKAAHQLFVSSGGRDDLGAAQIAIDSGRTGDAVTFARREWTQRQFGEVADVLAWAYHLAGNDRAALPYAHRALALDPGRSGFRYHLAMIELALGNEPAAHQDLARALARNPYFSPVDAPIARQLLREMRHP